MSGSKVEGIMNFSIAPKDKKVMKSSKVRKYMAEVNKVMNAKFDQKFWREYHTAMFLGLPFAIFIPEKGKAEIELNITK